MNESAPVDNRRRWWPIAKWLLFAVLMYFIGNRAFALWQSSPPISLHVDIRWLVPAAAWYLAGWLPSVWFWRNLMRQMGHPVGWYPSIRAYYVGHMGKYAPGKALVLIIRGALIQQAGGNAMLAAATAVYDTLVSMTVAAAIGLALAPLFIADSLWPASLAWLRDQPILVPLVVFVAVIASTPLSASLFTWIGRKTIVRGGNATTTGIKAKHVLQGVLVALLSWTCNAISLGFTLQSVSSDAIDFKQFPVWLASVCLSTFFGFVILIAPGGLGVREGVLAEMLKDQPGIGGEKALIVAGLLRAVWFLSEAMTAAVLYLIKPRLQRRDGPIRES